MRTSVLVISGGAGVGDGSATCVEVTGAALAAGAVEVPEVAVVAAVVGAASVSPPVACLHPNVPTHPSAKVTRLTTVRTHIAV